MPQHLLDPRPPPRILVQQPIQQLHTLPTPRIPRRRIPQMNRLLRIRKRELAAADGVEQDAEGPHLGFGAAVAGAQEDFGGAVLEGSVVAVKVGCGGGGDEGGVAEVD